MFPKILFFIFMTHFFTSFFIRMKIINTPVLIHIPSPRLHEIIILESHHTKEKFAIDFTPIRSTFTTLSLFLGKNVPAEVRVREIPEEVDISNTQELLSILSKTKEEKINELTHPFFCFKTRSVILQNFLSKAVSFKDFEKNNFTMNLYTRNCRHFSNHVKTLYNSLK